MNIIDRKRHINHVLMISINDDIVTWNLLLRIFKLNVLMRHNLLLKKTIKIKRIS